MKRTALLSLVLACGPVAGAVPACSQDAPAADGSENGADASLLTDTASSSDVIVPPRSDGGADATPPPPPCIPAAALEAEALFVDAMSGVDDTNALRGTRALPFKTLSASLVKALTATGTKRINVHAGVYAEAVSPPALSATASPLVIEGGFSVAADGTWFRHCADAGVDARTLTRIESPTTIGIHLTQMPAGSMLKYLSVATGVAVAAPTGTAGASSVGVWLERSPGFVLDTVLIDAQASAAAGNTPAAVATAAVQCPSTGGVPCSNGAPGSTSGPGGPGSGSWNASGAYAPVDGVDGTDGTSGQHGTPPATPAGEPQCKSCNSGVCSASDTQKICTCSSYVPPSSKGTCGCGGTPGRGGRGGAGGGASIGVLVSGAGAPVTATQANIRAGAGGAGAGGASGGAGTQGTSGAPGQNSTCATGAPFFVPCTTPGCPASGTATYLGQIAGGVGGKGGNGSGGGGGVGGPSCAVAVVNGATFSSASSSLAHGPAGASAAGAPTALALDVCMIQ